MDGVEQLREGVEAYQAGRLQDAEAAFVRSLEARPDRTTALNLGITRNKLLRFADALPPMLKAAEAKPLDAPLQVEIGLSYRNLADLESAERHLRVALEAEPASALAKFRLSTVLLAQGRYAEAWPLWESRPSRLASPLRELRFPEWRGEPLSGRSILLWCEQGLGDEIQFARFARTLRKLGAAKITLACRQPNLRLLAQCADAVLSRDDPARFPDHDFWLMLGSLPGRLAVDVEEVGAEPYLAAQPAGARGRIGVVYRGNPAHELDPLRSLPDELGRELLALPGAISLHPEDTGARDMQETANILAGLEWVISVDTSVAHLAGSLGRPVWVLLPAYGTDWRWMQGRSDSPWYASMRLFRQNEPGEWTPVIEEISRLLA